MAFDLAGLQRRPRAAGEQEQGEDMKKFAPLAAAVVIGLLAVSAAAATQTDIPLSGAGSSLVNPLVQQYIPAVGSAFGYSLSYASVGSGAGIADISSRTV